MARTKRFALMIACLPGLAWADPATDVALAYRETGSAGEVEVYLRRTTGLTLGPLSVIYGGSITDRGALWAGIGLGGAIPLGPNWTIDASVLPGLYSNGDAADLGSVVEFRSSIGVSRRLGRGRLGIGYDHISNASLGEDNPGSDGIFLRYTFSTQ